MTTKPIISVIVPIFNVEMYVRKCLESLRCQTLKEIEIICIDDGSIDSSGSIADEFKNDEWPMFKVIHTENRGLSAARNRGLDEARAEWVMFVDSDDWVDKDFCRIPYEIAKRGNADLVIFNWNFVKKGRICKVKRTDAPIGKIDVFTAHEFGSTVVWNKMYKKNLFKGIRFPVGRAFEEIATTHKIVSNAKQIIMLTDYLYFYVDRETSISHNYTPKKRKDLFIGTLERNDYLMKQGYPYKRLIGLLQKNAISYLVSVPSDDDDELYVRARDIVNQIHGIPSNFTGKQKVALIAWKLDKKLFYLISKFSGRMSEVRCLRK